MAVQESVVEHCASAVILRARPPTKEHRKRNHWRRQSVPANPREVYTGK